LETLLLLVGVLLLLTIPLLMGWIAQMMADAASGVRRDLTPGGFEVLPKASESIREDS